MKSYLWFGLVVAGCGSVSSSPDAAPVGPPAYLGVWEVSAGDLWNKAYGTPRFVEFDADGGGSLHTRFEPSGVLGCGLEFLHARVLDGFLAVDIAGQRLYRYELTDDDTLVVSDQTGSSLTLTRTTEVPASAKCGELQVAETVSDIHVTMHSFSGLGIQSPTAFWVSNNDYKLTSINPSTGAATPAPTPTSQYVHVQAFDGANYWAHCGCGGSEDIELHAPDSSSTALEIIDTVELGAGISVRTAAVDGTTLWLAGYARDGSGTNRVLKLEKSGSTHTLSDSFAFSNVTSLATLGGELWALTVGSGATLVRIDTTSKLATASYTLPTGYTWQAMGASGGSLWIAGREPDGDMRLIRVTAPQ